MYKENNEYKGEIAKDEVAKRTNEILDRFKENYIKNNNKDFINDAITNMIVCCKAYEKIFEGFIVIAQINNLPQELIEGFVKWSSGQL